MVKLDVESVANIGTTFLGLRVPAGSRAVDNALCTAKSGA
jgi:hypothetical protein